MQTHNLQDLELNEIETLLKSQKILPLGLQHFTGLRKNGYIYVDKTAMLTQLIDTGKAYFLSRPRRFGKSLTLSTLEALLTGNKEAFVGLKAESWMNQEDFTPSPVIYLDMTAITSDDTVSNTRMTATSALKTSALKNGIELAETDPTLALVELIEKIYYRDGKEIALHIDEYDSLILNYLDVPDEAHKVRSILKGFYQQIKKT
jgi:hypothetical protein